VLEVEACDGPDEPAWRRRTRGEPRWPATIASLVLVAVPLLLPDFGIGPRWLAPTLEAVLLTTAVVVNPVRMERQSPVLRLIELTLLATATLVVTWTVGQVLHDLWTGDNSADGRALLVRGAGVWLSDVVLFALWYWQLDRDGPTARAEARRPYPDLLFPQMTNRTLADPDWEPTFGDYLYLSFTNTAGFGPGDTVPLTRRMKYAMLGQAASALVTVVVVIASGVNALG
jgi:uncharacterized membrane protein